MRTLLCQRRVASGLQCRRMTLDSTRHSEYVLSSCMTCLLHLWLHYMWVANPSVVCNVHAPYSGGWNFRLYFCAILYLSNTLTSITEIIPGGTSPLGAFKRERDGKIERWWTYRRLYLIPVSRSGSSSLDEFLVCCQLIAGSALESFFIFCTSVPICLSMFVLRIFYLTPGKWFGQFRWHLADRTIVEVPPHAA